MRLAAVLVLAASIAAAQDVFTPHHVAKLRLVASAAMAPDGSEIAYVVSVPRSPLEEDGAAWEELHLVSADGSSRAFVTGQVNVAAPRWTPDGQHILFLARRASDDTRALYLLARNGGEARRLVTHETDIVSFDVSADGRQVAFLARAAVAKERQELARRGFNQEVFEETLLPVRVWVAPIANHEAGAARLIDLPGSASVVTWDPAGARVMVVYAPTPLVDDDLMRRRVHIVDAAGGALIGKIDNPGKIGQVSWSPDGDTLAMVSAADLNDPAEGRLMVTPAKGGSLRDVLPQYQAHVRGFAWKDADTLVYFADEGVESVIGEVRRDGSAQRTLVAPGQGPIVTAMDRGRSGAIALVAEAPRHPSEVFLLTAAGGEPRRLTDVNPWLATMRLAPQETVTYKARDGLELQGILIRPLDEQRGQRGQRYPLILTVHGGPEARDANGWRTSYANAGQVGAAQGFAVFYPNTAAARGVASRSRSCRRATRRARNSMTSWTRLIISSPRASSIAPRSASPADPMAGMRPRGAPPITRSASPPPSCSWASATRSPRWAPPISPMRNISCTHSNVRGRPGMRCASAARSIMRRNRERRY